MFDADDCLIPTVYCGSSKALPKRKINSDTYYYKFGTPRECLMKGFGAGGASERLKNVNDKSLQNIKYVGETYESNFGNSGINNTTQLINFCRSHSVKNIDNLLSSVFQRGNEKGKNIDMKAYNSTLLFLYRHGNVNLPKCYKFSSQSSDGSYASPSSASSSKSGSYRSPSSSKSSSYRSPARSPGTYHGPSLTSKSRTSSPIIRKYKSTSRTPSPIIVRKYKSTSHTSSSNGKSLKKKSPK